MGLMDEKFIAISEIMTRHPVKMQANKSVSEAAQLMARYHVGTLLIMRDEELVGVLSVTDITYDVVAQGKNPEQVLVDEIMSTTIISIDPEKDIKDAIELMNEYELRILPVMVGKRLVGYITMKDILRIEPTLFDMAVDSIRTEEHRRQQKIEKLSHSDGFFDVNDIVDEDSN